VKNIKPQSVEENQTRQTSKLEKVWKKVLKINEKRLKEKLLVNGANNWCSRILIIGFGRSKSSEKFSSIRKMAVEIDFSPSPFTTLDSCFPKMLRTHYAAAITGKKSLKENITDSRQWGLAGW
jgi:hypothetical protein